MAEVFGVRLNPDGLARVPPDQWGQGGLDVGQVQQLWRLAPTDHPPSELATPSPGADLEVRQTDEQRLRRQHPSGNPPSRDLLTKGRTQIQQTAQPRQINR